MLPDHGLSPRESTRRRHSEHIDDRHEASGAPARSEMQNQAAGVISAEAAAVRLDAPDAAMHSSKWVDSAAEASAAAAAEPSALPLQREATGRGGDRRYRDPSLQAERKKAATQEAEEERRRLLSEREAHMQRQARFCILFLNTFEQNICRSFLFVFLIF